MADEIKNEQVNEEEMNIDEESTSTDASLKTDEKDEKKDVDSKHIPYDRFKAKVDEANALKKKLTEIEDANKEAERKKLEEQNEYKTLYEQAVEQANQAKQEVLATKRNAMLAQVGYGEEQTELLAKLVEGDTDEEIAESIAKLQTTIPAQDNYGDPSAFNGAKAKPETVDKEDVGRNAINKVLNKIKL